MIRQKIAQIEFHCSSSYELEDLIVRMAPLINEGYHICKMNWSEKTPISAYSVPLDDEPIFHITLQRDNNFTKL